jgi:hypothetical protein
MKKILLSLVAIIAVILIIAAFLPKTMNIKVNTTIDAPRTAVRNYVIHLANQTNYSVRVMADPDIKLSYSGIDGTVGFTQSWDSDMKNVGKGEQEITRIEKNLSYDVEIRFEKPMPGTNYATTTLADTGNNQTLVTTSFSGPTPRPFNILCPFMTPTLRKDMAQNLANLKAILEK